MPVPKKKAAANMTPRRQPEALGIAEPATDLPPTPPSNATRLPLPQDAEISEEVVSPLPPVAEISEEVEDIPQEIEQDINAMTPRTPPAADMEQQALRDLSHALEACYEHSNVAADSRVERADSVSSQLRSGPSNDTAKNARKSIEEYSKFLSLQSLGSFCEGDLKLAEHIAKTRGLPPELEPGAVRAFLLQYGYDAFNVRDWGKPAEQQPQLSINLTCHIEFGEHTHYEVICKVAPQPGAVKAAVSWRTLRRLKHIRAGLHDPVKKALGKHYDKYFGAAPFAHHAAPTGTTARLKAWFACLADCINFGSVTPEIAARTFRLLDGPGTPLITTGGTTNGFEQIPITASMFGSRVNNVPQGHCPSKTDLPRVALGGSSKFADSLKEKLPAGLSFQTGSLDIEFEDHGQDQKIQILRRPLGAEFRKDLSGIIKVSKVRPKSHAEEIGMEVGWVVKSVSGFAVHTMTFQEVQDTIKVALLHLPLAA